MYVDALCKTWTCSGTGLLFDAYYFAGLYTIYIVFYFNIFYMKGVMSQVSLVPQFMEKILFLFAFHYFVLVILLVPAK